MTTAPPLNGHVIGQAHYATRALLERRLDRLGVTFPQSVVLNFIGRGGQAEDGAQRVERQVVIGRLTGGLKIDADAAEAIVVGTTDAGLISPVEGTSELELTETGRRHLATIGAGIAELTARLYGDFPTEELAAAARVLATVTERANAELAATAD
jgi:DNA-binding MarR family transcriptional regulator